MNHMKIFFYLACISVSTLYANRDTPTVGALQKQIEALSEDNEALIEENAELLADKEELKTQVTHYQNKKCSEHNAVVHKVEPVPTQPVESKRSYLERAKEKAQTLISNAKGFFKRS